MEVTGMSGNRRKSVDETAGCNAAFDAYREGDYERVARALQTAQTASGQAGDAVMARILEATQLLCRDCVRLGVEADWYEHARSEVQERENALHRNLGMILQLLGTDGLAAAPGDQTDPAQDLSREWNESKSYVFARRQTLWKRVQSLLLPAPWNEEHERARAAVSLTPASPDRDAPATIVDSTATALQRPERDSVVVASDLSATQRSLTVYCLGSFEVYQNDQPIHDWPNSKSKTLFKYLVTHRERPITKEILMELFWPNVDSDNARNSLNVAIYRVRQSLSTGSSFPHVLFQDNCYLLNPDLDVRVDVEAFVEHIRNAHAHSRRGDQALMIAEYHAAEALYRGQFLEEDRYEVWIAPIRQSLQKDYLKLLEILSRFYFDQEDYESCVGFCNKVLAVEACQEDAHCLMMRCYSRQKRTNLAVRQYKNCVEALKRELGVVPSLSTIEMYQRIRNCHPV
jgi:DNA-binding SARP family transcriptional activator